MDRQFIFKSKFHVEFYYCGFSCDPDVISATLGLTPTKSWRKGDVGPAPAMKRRSSAWEIKSRLPVTHKITEQIDDVVAQLAGVEEQLKALDFGGEFRMLVALYIVGDERPPFYVSKRAIKFMANLDADLDIDLYRIPDDDDG